MKEQGTLKITDDNGQSVHKRGDDKIMCPNETSAEVVVEALSQYLNVMFFKYDEKGYIRWEGFLNGDYKIRNSFR